MKPGIVAVGVVGAIVAALGLGALRAEPGGDDARPTPITTRGPYRIGAACDNAGADVVAACDELQSLDERHIGAAFADALVVGEWPVVALPDGRLRLTTRRLDVAKPDPRPAVTAERIQQGLRGQTLAITQVPTSTDGVPALLVTAVWETRDVMAGPGTGQVPQNRIDGYLRADAPCAGREAAGRCGDMTSLDRLQIGGPFLSALTVGDWPIVRLPDGRLRLVSRQLDLFNPRRREADDLTGFWSNAGGVPLPDTTEDRVHWEFTGDFGTYRVTVTQSETTSGGEPALLVTAVWETVASVAD